MKTAHAIIPDIVDQHVEEAAFLWTQRAAAVQAPHYSLRDLARLDERLEAHIDGLRVAGDAGWDLCLEAMNDDDPGTVFAAAVLAFESADGAHIDAVVTAGSRSLPAFRALVSALGWVPDASFAALKDGLLRANSLHYRRLGVAGCAVRRDDPGNALEEAARSADLFLRSRALKAAGELKRADLVPALRKNLENENHTCRFAAAESLLLLGDPRALDVMGQFVLTPSPFRPAAMQIALRCVEPAAARAWLKALSQDKAQMRDVMVGTGIAGDALYVPTQIKRMKDPVLARVAGEAFSMITGVDLAYQDLEGDWPEGFEAGPNDDPLDEDVAMDADEDLPWPDPALVAQWWAANGGGFAAGTRYLAGSVIEPQQCLQVLKQGMQRQRNAAALELALLRPDAAFFNTAAPGFRQQREL